MAGGTRRGLVEGLRRHRVALVFLTVEGVAAGLLAAVPTVDGEQSRGSHLGLLATMTLIAGTVLQVIVKSGRDIITGEDKVAAAEQKSEAVLRVATDVQAYFLERVPSLLALLGRLIAAESAETRRELAASLETLVVDSAATLYGKKDLRAVVLHYADGMLTPGDFRRGFENTVAPVFRDEGQVRKQILRLIEEKTTVWVDVPDDFRHSQSLPLRPADVYRSFVRVPLCAGSYGYGVLWVDGRNDSSLVEADAAPLEALAGVLAAGLAVVTGADGRMRCQA